MQFETKNLTYDIVVAGGGLSGVCAAIAAARLGRRVAIINNRGYIGGNASAEINVSTAGATGTQEFNFWAREDGIIEEILLENLHRNPHGNRWIWDGVLLDFIYAEKNIDMYLNTTVMEAIMEGDRIKAIRAVSSISETQYVMEAPVFIEDTGDGTLGALAGAEFMLGREERAVWDEPIAPEEPDRMVLPSTMGFWGRDVGTHIDYYPPKFATDMKTTHLEDREIPPERFATNQWFYEMDGHLDQVKDIEQIIYDQRAFVYGVWDYIKNSGKFPQADTYDLAFISSLPGRREWRRLIGDVVLTENDVTGQTQFDDAIAHGGWSIDLHALEGIFSSDIENRHYVLSGIFRIPYRSCYSKNVKNLLIASRCLSVSHVAHGSTRLIATLSMIGQAIGTAAHLCVRNACDPREIYPSHMDELRLLLRRADHTLPGIPLNDPDNVAATAKIAVSSTHPSGCMTADGFRSMADGEGFGLVIPCTPDTREVKLLLRSEEQTSLEYKVWLPSNHESFDPRTRIFNGRVSVEPSENGRTVSLPLPTVTEPRYLFVEIARSESVTIGFTRRMQPCAMSLIKRPNNHATTWDVHTRCVKEYMYRRAPFSFCFSLDTPMYRKENLQNGLTRPFDGTNLWASDGDTDGEWVSFTLKKKEPLSRLVLTFDSGLDREYRSGRTYAFNAMQELVSDFDVYAGQGKDLSLVCEVKGNYLRRREIDLCGIDADRVKIVFRKTCGTDCFRLYQAAIYPVKENPDTEKEEADA